MARTKQDPRYAKTYKTAVFNIHNPSQRKQRALRDALKRNHLAYTKLLPVALERLDELAKITGDTKYRTNKARIDAVRKFISPKIVCLPLGNGAKAGLQEDIADTLAAYLALMDDYEKECAKEEKEPEDKRKQISRPGLPTAKRLTPFQQAHEEAYDALARSLTKEEEDKARDDIAREGKSGLTRPILFLKNRISDGFLILYDEAKERYFIYLNLHSKDNRFAKPIDLGGLIDIRSGEVFPEMKTSRTGLLLSINFAAEFQDEKFMAAGKSASAKLMERKGRFEVHVAFEYQTLKIEPATQLGVDRGIYNLASLCVIDDVGGIIAEKKFRRAAFAQCAAKRRTSPTQHPKARQNL